MSQRNYVPPSPCRILRQKSSRPFKEHTIPKPFRDYASAELLPLLNLPAKRKLKEWNSVAIQCLHNLVLCGFADICVRDTRDNSQAGMRTQVWDSIVKAKLAFVCVGDYKKHRQSLYLATDELLSRFENWKLAQLIDTRLKRNSLVKRPRLDALVVIKDEQSRPVPIPSDLWHDGLNFRDYLESVEDKLEFINQVNLNHRWIGFKIVDEKTGKQRAFQPNVCLRQIHSGKPFHYARLYSWSELSAQNLRKKERKLIRIDGEEVCELDFSCHNLRLLYHCCNIDPDPTEDLYRPQIVLPRQHRRRPKSTRKAIKVATNICLNVGSRNAALNAVGRHVVKAFPKLATNATKIVDGICTAHPDIEDLFFTNRGCFLQTVDGAIMLRILHRLASKDIPALGIHDSILCRRSDFFEADMAMTFSYRTITKFKPVISREF